ncbi:MAG: hypothetical protein WCG06_03820, partial [Candidatus Omnitrophota bacterium]
MLSPDDAGKMLSRILTYDEFQANKSNLTALFENGKASAGAALMHGARLSDANTSENRALLPSEYGLKTLVFEIPSLLVVAAKFYRFYGGLTPGAFTAIGSLGVAYAVYKVILRLTTTRSASSGPEIFEKASVRRESSSVAISLALHSSFLWFLGLPLWVPVGIALTVAVFLYEVNRHEFYKKSSAPLRRHLYWGSWVSAMVLAFFVPEVIRARGTAGWDAGRADRSGRPGILKADSLPQHRQSNSGPFRLRPVERPLSSGTDEKSAGPTAPPSQSSQAGEAGRPKISEIPGGDKGFEVEYRTSVPVYQRVRVDSVMDLCSRNPEIRLDHMGTNRRFDTHQSMGPGRRLYQFRMKVTFKEDLPTGTFLMVFPKSLSPRFRPWRSSDDRRIFMTHAFEVGQPSASGDTKPRTRGRQAWVDFYLDEDPSRPEWKDADGSYSGSLCFDLGIHVDTDLLSATGTRLRLKPNDIQSVELESIGQISVQSDEDEAEYYERRFKPDYLKPSTAPLEQGQSENESGLRTGVQDNGARLGAAPVPDQADLERQEAAAAIEFPYQMEGERGYLTSIRNRSTGQTIEFREARHKTGAPEKGAVYYDSITDGSGNTIAIESQAYRFAPIYRRLLEVSASVPKPFGVFRKKIFTEFLQPGLHYKSLPPAQKKKCLLALVDSLSVFHENAIRHGHPHLRNVRFYQKTGTDQIEAVLCDFKRLAMRPDLDWNDSQAIYQFFEEDYSYLRTALILFKQAHGVDLSSEVFDRLLSSYPITDEGRVPQLMRKYTNLYGDLSAGSGCNALKRDRKYAVKFLNEFQDRLMFGT